MVLAQNDEQAIRQLVETQTRKIMTMRTPLDVKEYMKAYTPSYTAMRSDYLVDGTVNHSNVSKELIENRLNSYALNTKTPLTITLDRFNFVNVMGNTGVANYTINFDVKDNGMTSLGGFQNITSTFVKTTDGWKISRSHITEVRTTMQQYTCKFQMFTETTSSYMAKVSYPTGSSFETDFIEVKLNDMGGNNYVLHTNKGDQFEWNNGMLQLPNPQTGVVRAEKATSQPAVFRELIKYYYPQHCPEAELQK